MMADASLARDWAGWLVLVLSFLAIALVREARRNGRVARALFVVLALHHLVALTNAYLLTTPGADADAQTFQRMASEIAQGEEERTIGTGAHVYRLLLASVYRVFGVSHLLGEELSILAFLASCAVLLRTLHLLGLSERAPALLLLFGALPSMVFFGSVTLREPWQILFLVAAIHAALRYQRRHRAVDLTKFAIFAVGMGMFHDALLIYATFLVGALAVLAMPGVGGSLYGLARRAAVAVALVGVLVSGMALLASTAGEGRVSWLFTTVFKGDVVERLQEYREGGIRVAEEAEARTTYGITLDSTSWQTMVATTLPAFVLYMWAPFPWQITNALDVYAVAETAWRTLLLIAALVTWRRASGAERRFYGFLLLTYVSMAAFWSLGTVNFGTAIRHHTLSYPILVLMGAPRVLEAWRSALTALTARAERLTGVRAG